MADSGQERTEEATPRRRQDARKKGTVTKSVELTNSLVMIGLLMALPVLVSQLGRTFLLSINRGFSQIPTTANPADIAGYTWSLAQPMIIAILPLFALAMGIGVMANFAQVGFVLSTESLSPQFSKINPLNGLKKLFSAQSGMEGMKAIFKTALFGYLAYSVVQSHWEILLNLSKSSIGETMTVIGMIMRTIFLRVAIAWLVLAAIDYFFQRHQVNKQLRMTKEEVKQEYRQNEQSPELRAAMSQRRRKLLKGRTAQAVKTANVIITNPTHFAVALKYDPSEMFAPQVVAKGADHLAFKIRELAKEARVPIVPNPPLARQLYKKCEIGDYVPRDLFQAVAEVLAYVYATLDKVRKAS